MPASPVTVTKSGPGLAQFRRDLTRVSKSEVLVGIPAAKAPRSLKKGKGPVINNAALLWIHAHGSPLKHIPARPVLEPAVEKNKEIITPHLAEASKAILDRDPMKAERELKLAGTIAANAAKRYVMVGSNLAPNAPSTIKRKKSSRPLIGSGAMISAIISVVRQNT